MRVAKSGILQSAVEVTSVAAMLVEAGVDTDLREKRTPVVRQWTADGQKGRAFVQGRSRRAAAARSSGGSWWRENAVKCAYSRLQSTKVENRGSAVAAAAADLPSDRVRGSYCHILPEGGRHCGQNFVCLVEQQSCTWCLGEWCARKIGQDLSRKTVRDFCYVVAHHRIKDSLWRARRREGLMIGSVPPP